MNSKALTIIYGIKEAINETDNTKKVIKLHILLSKLTKRLLEINYEVIPGNISELVTFLKTVPICNYIDDEISAETAIDKYSELTDEFLEIVSEDNFEEAGQKLMYKLLKHIRESDMNNKEETYQNVRKFIIGNFYISARNFEIKIKRTFGRGTYIEKLLRDMYEYVDHVSGEYLVCPVCGKDINMQDSKNGTCTKVCNFYINKYNLTPKKVTFINRILKLNEGIYRYNLMSSIGEFEIYNKCLKRFDDKKVVLYPNVDEYDISLEDTERNILINLDVKDARTPKKLMEILLNNTDLKKLQYNSNRVLTYIVIPEHREFIYNMDSAQKYTTELQKLINDGNLNITVISERKLYCELERVFEEL